MLRQFLILTSTIFFIAGCARVEIESSKTSGYQETLNRVLVSISIEVDQIKSPLVAKSLSEKLAGRGITVRVVEHEMFEQEDPLKSAWNEFNPNQVLTVVATGAASNGINTLVALDGNIYNVPTRNTVWRFNSKVKFAHLFLQTVTDQEIADRFADTIIQKLDADRLLPPPPTPPNKPS